MGDMRRLLRAVAASGAATLGAVLAGVVRVKLYAVYLGAAGMGIISQVQNLLNALAVLAMLGLGVGVARQVARARGADDAAGIARTLSTARLLGGGAALLLAAGVVLGARPLSTLLFGEPRYALYVATVAPALLFATLGRVQVEVLNGFRDYAANARVTLGTAALSVTLLLPLLLTLGLAGAVAAIPLTAVGGFLLARAQMSGRHPELRRTPMRLDAATGRGLLALGALSLIVAFSDQLVLLAIRTRLILLHGVQGNGLFQGVWGLSQHLLQIVVAYVSGYSFARVHEARERQAVLAETDRTARVTLLLMTPLTAGVVLLRAPLVDLFLSAEFRPALGLFPYQAAGDLLRSVGMAVGVGVLAVARPRAWLAMGLSAPAAFLGAFWLLSSRVGIESAAMAHAVAGAVYLATAWAIMRAAGGLRLTGRTWGTAAASALLLGGVILLTRRVETPYAWGALLLLAWGIASLRRREAREVLRLLSERLGGR